jgi:histidinol-phosphate/aromatic aminotransferase/cobyric acid decarboxylase-like protein
MTTVFAETAAIDFGPQGGDPSRGVDMDLSTCVNRYGPAPAAVSALHQIQPADIVLHPYDAVDQMIDVYRWATDVRYGAMIAGRGATEFIWAMGRELEHRRVRIPLPAYTDYLKVFPGRGFSVLGEQVPSIEQLDAALAGGHVVIISNPHNPTGVHLYPNDLVAAAGARPESILVVDESYVGFTPNPSSASVIGCDVPNIVVLQSTTKFYGIAATRTGIAWCADPELLSLLFGRQENWGLSGVDVRVACAAIRDVDWAEESRRQMLVDNAWLGELLRAVDGVHLYANANVHFQYALCERAAEFADALAGGGIGVRVLGAAHGVHPDALRIVAPRVDERQRFAAAVREACDVLR